MRASLAILLLPAVAAAQAVTVQNAGPHAWSGWARCEVATPLGLGAGWLLTPSHRTDALFRSDGTAVDVWCSLGPWSSRSFDLAAFVPCRMPVPQPVEMVERFGGLLPTIGDLSAQWVGVAWVGSAIESHLRYTGGGCTVDLRVRWYPDIASHVTATAVVRYEQGETQAATHEELAIQWGDSVAWALADGALGEPGVLLPAGETVAETRPIDLTFVWFRHFPADTSGWWREFDRVEAAKGRRIR